MKIFQLQTGKKNLKNNKWKLQFVIEKNIYGGNPSKGLFP